MKFIYRTREQRYGYPLLDERRSQRARRKAAAPASLSAKPKG
jgi:hypothetical protein